MIELVITPTSKSYHPASNWQRWQDERYRFPDMKAAKQFLRERYGKASRRAMYMDQRTGPPVKCGYVIGFRNGDGSGRWLQQDWVEFRECKIVNMGEMR